LDKRPTFAFGQDVHTGLSIRASIQVCDNNGVPILTATDWEDFGNQVTTLVEKIEQLQAKVAEAREWWAAAYSADLNGEGPARYRGYRLPPAWMLPPIQEKPLYPVVDAPGGQGFTDYPAPIQENP
jgi:hypothetical protein